MLGCVLVSHVSCLDGLACMHRDAWRRGDAPRCASGARSPTWCMAPKLRRASRPRRRSCSRVGRHGRARSAGVLGRSRPMKEKPGRRRRVGAVGGGARGRDRRGRLRERIEGARAVDRTNPGRAGRRPFARGTEGSAAVGRETAMSRAADSGKSGESLKSPGASADDRSLRGEDAIRTDRGRWWAGNQEGRIGWPIGSLWSGMRP